MAASPTELINNLEQLIATKLGSVSNDPKRDVTASCMHVVEDRAKKLQRAVESSQHISTHITSTSHIHCKGPDDLLSAVIGLRNYFHTVICRQWLVDRVATRLQMVSKRLTSLEHRVCRLRGHRCSQQLAAAAQRCRTQREVLATLSSDRKYSLLATQRFAVRVNSFISERLEPLRTSLYTEPALQLSHQASKAKAQQQAFLSSLTRKLSDHQAAFAEVDSATNQLSSFVASLVPAEAPNVVWNQNDANGLQMNQSLCSLLLKRFQSETDDNH